MQNLYGDVVGVHTDSVISRQPLPVNGATELGAWAFETKGDGILLGSGVYQIGDKSRFRGFPTKTPLRDALSTSGKEVVIPVHRPHTWREVIFHGHPPEYINRFVDEDKSLNINFDTKRLWYGEWRTPRQVFDKPLESSPLVYSDLLGF